MSTAARVTGKVKFWNGEKGFGFVVPDDNSGDVFVHVTGLANSIPHLLPDQRVSYEVVASDRGKGNGKKAANVKLV
jgi:CspA family cold shock protein